MTAPTLFGTLPDGRTVSRARLGGGGGLSLDLLDYGAIVQRLELPVGAKRRNLVLGFDSLDAYLVDRAYQGCVIGRCANRIAKAWFSIDGVAHSVTANEGLTCLHGGALGFSRRLWRFTGLDDRRAVLTYSSPDGEEGFPGQVDAKATFALIGEDALEISYEAVCDRPTPVNLTHHLYFNLSDEPTILDHRLTIAARAFTPIRPDLTPTGALAMVRDTPFDLTKPRRIGDALAGEDPQFVLAGGFDHNWALDEGAEPALTLASPDGVTLRLTTDQPGVQIYGGQGLAAPFAAHGGLAIEPQGFPDAVNRPNFPSVVLRPGQVYRRKALYRFSA